MQVLHHVSGCNVGVVYHILSAHTACYGAVHHYSAHQIAYVGSLSACGYDVHTLLSQFGKELFCAVYDGRDYFARYKMLVSSDG